MQKNNRREVIKKSAMALLSISSKPGWDFWKSKTDEQMKGNKIGIQLFTIPSLVDQDFVGTLQSLSKIGYQEIEFFGPYPFSAESSKKAWDQLSTMLNLKQHAFYGHSVAEVASLLKENDLAAPSVHTSILTMRDGLRQFLDGISQLGSKYAVVPALLNASDRNSKDAYLRLADEFNSFGEIMSEYDMTFVYHNHGYEHVNYDGEMGLDILLRHTDPALVQFELDIFWMKAAGADPLAYLRQYPDRFKLMHLKDASQEFRFSGDGGSPDQWMAGFPLMSDPGDGVFDIKGMIEEGKKSGVMHFFLERDLAPDPDKTLTNSFAKLKQWM